LKFHVVCPLQSSQTAHDGHALFYFKYTVTGLQVSRKSSTNLQLHAWSPSS